MEMKNYLLVGIMALSMVNLSSCRDEEDFPASVNPGLKGEMEEIAPHGAKERLQKVGIEFVEAIGARDHENLVALMAFMEKEDYEDYKLDGDYYMKLKKLYDEERESFDSYVARMNPVSAIQGLMAISLEAAQNGAQLATRASNIYMLSVQAGLKDLYGGFTPTKGEWKYDDSVTDRIEVKFKDDNGRTWIATLKGSEQTTHVNMKSVYDGSIYDNYQSVDVSYGESMEFSVDVPKEITFTLQCGNATIVDMNITSELDVDAKIADNTYYYRDFNYVNYYGYVLNKYEYESEYKLTLDYTYLSVDARLNVNGYEEIWVAESKKQGGRTSAEVKIDGKSMLKYEASAKLDVDGFIEQINKYNSYSEYAYSEEEYEELLAGDEGYYNDSYEDIDASCLDAFSMYLDIMGKVQIVGKCEDIKALYDAWVITEAEEDEYRKLLESSRKKFYEKIINDVNQTYEITIHYDGTKTEQAHVELETALSSGNEYYYQPILVFAMDDSRYTFEGYFSGNAFNRLKESVEALCADFEGMVDDNYQWDY